MVKDVDPYQTRYEETALPRARLIGLEKRWRIWKILQGMETDGEAVWSRKALLVFGKKMTLYFWDQANDFYSLLQKNHNGCLRLLYHKVGGGDRSSTFHPTSFDSLNIIPTNIAFRICRAMIKADTGNQACGLHCYAYCISTIHSPLSSSSRRSSPP